MERLNLLFVCSMNQWRSPTAEKIYAHDPRVDVRSGGTSSKARRRISVKDVNWADLVVVMEKKHKQRLLSNFPDAMRYCEVHVLEIEDNYQFMNEELVAELRLAVDAILEAS